MIDTRLPITGPALFLNSIHLTLRSFPIACLTLALLTDIAYLQTSNLLWLHFSEWLLLAGLAFGIIAIVLSGVEFLFRRVRPAWSAVFAAIVVLVLAALNNFVHTADGWTAVMPWGVTLSALTVIAMLITAWFGREGAYHV